MSLQPSAILRSPGSLQAPDLNLPPAGEIIHSPAVRFVSRIAVFYIEIAEVPNLRWLFHLPGTGLGSLSWQVF